MDHRETDEPEFSNTTILLVGISADLLRVILGWTSNRNAGASSVITDSLHSSSDLTTSIITLLANLTTQHLCEIVIDSWKLEFLETFLSLFIGTSRIGLALHTACENVVALKFRCPREVEGQILRNKHLETISIAIMTIFVKEWMHRKSKYN
jgi:divalent metal cation (Fe/Co/Zn/Cd) transporter